MGDAYECLGPIQDNVPDAPPEPAVPAADAPAAAPLRDDGIDLNSNPLSNKETEKGKGKSKEAGAKGQTPKEQKTSKSQMTTQSAPLTFKDEKKPQKKKGKGKGKKAKKTDLKKQSKIWVIGFIACTFFFFICLALLIFIAGHRWFGLTAISAIAYE